MPFPLAILLAGLIGQCSQTMSCGLGVVQSRGGNCACDPSCLQKGTCCADACVACGVCSRFVTLTREEMLRVYEQNGCCVDDITSNNISHTSRTACPYVSIAPNVSVSFENFVLSWTHSACCEDNACHVTFDVKADLSVANSTSAVDESMCMHTHISRCATPCIRVPLPDEYNAWHMQCRSCSYLNSDDAPQGYTCEDVSGCAIGMDGRCVSVLNQ